MFMMTLKLKQAAAQAAIDFIEDNTIVGVGTGSTANCFIQALASIKHRIEGTVASSIATEKKLKDAGIPVFDLNTVDKLPLYIDGTDEFDPYFRLIKGGGGAQTREKLLAHTAETFICIADHSKQVERLGQHPIAIEVIPMARSLVGRELVKLGGNPVYRSGFITDNNNVILDVYDLDVMKAIELEQTLNNIVGIVGHGLFAIDKPKHVIVANNQETKILSAVTS